MGDRGTATGVRLPDHESYQFHISLAYRLLELTASEQQQLETLFADAETHIYDVAPEVKLPSPQCVMFADMLQFLPMD